MRDFKHDQHSEPYVEKVLCDYSDDSEVFVYQDIDEAYWIETEDAAYRVETIQDLYSHLTELDTEGIMVPYQLFHELELQMEALNTNSTDEE